MSKKILLADDSITIQKVISITFASEDYDLVVVGDGNTAITKIKEIKPNLIIADIAMPGKNGYEVCETVKKDPGLKHIPVLLLSGAFEPFNEEEAARVKADDIVIKPFESQELIEKVKNLLSRPPAAAHVEAEIPPPAPQVETTMPTDIWEVGDFIGTDEAAAPSPIGNGIWENDFFEEPAKEAEHKPNIEDELIELELKEDDIQPVEEATPPPSSKPPAVIPFTPEIKHEAPQPPPIPETPPMPTPLAAPKIVPIIQDKVEAKARECAVEEMPAIGAIPKEKLEETITKVSREVIEEIAWEIIPDLAEELIKEEIRKIKEAIGKVK